MAVAGRATAAGTARYAARFLDTEPAPADAALAPRGGWSLPDRLGLTLSSIGSAPTWATRPMTWMPATAPRWPRRCGAAATCWTRRSAIAPSAARSRWAGRWPTWWHPARIARDELVIASKAGFIAYRLEKPADPVQYVYDNFVAGGVAEPGDLAGGIHCMAPNYLSQQIAWSLRNTGLRTLDIYTIHNPETQLAFVDRETFRNRLQLAFARLEEEVAAGHIGCYGVSTWEGLRRPPKSAGYMSLEIMRPPGHRDGRRRTTISGRCSSRSTAAMLEAATFRNQPVRGNLLTALDAARALGLTVFASAALAQGQLPERTLSALAEAFPALTTPQQRLLQLARSQPGVTTALMGTTQVEHVRENLAVAAYPPEPEKAHRLAHALTR